VAATDQHAIPAPRGDDEIIRHQAVTALDEIQHAL
jgi:hypothetical protein